MGQAAHVRLLERWRTEEAELRAGAEGGVLRLSMAALNGKPFSSNVALYSDLRNPWSNAMFEGLVFVFALFFEHKPASTTASLHSRWSRNMRKRASMDLC
jgi:hypothetical protein